MKKPTAALLFNVVVLLSLILGGAVPLAPARARSPEEPALTRAQVASSAPAQQVKAAGVTEGVPPLELTVTDDASLHVPFKLDLDVMLGPWNDTATSRVKQPASWESAYLPVASSTAGQVAGVAAGSERYMAVWLDQGSNTVQSYVWWPKSDTDGKHKNLQLEAQGTPAVVALTPERIVVLVRDASDFVQFRWWEGTEEEPWAGTWFQVPGNYRVGSDPAAVAQDSSHMALFFRDSDTGTVKFTEWQAGVDWRSEPLDLGNPEGTQIVSGLAPVSRNDRHIAVFGVGQDNVLYYRERTTLNASDWSDTVWVEVADSVVSNSQISAASRHGNQMAVAFARTDGVVAYKEWLSGSGWWLHVPLGDPGFSHGLPPVIAVTDIDTMSFFGVGQAGLLKSIECGPQGSCSAWKAVDASSVSDPSVRTTAVVRRRHDLIILGRSVFGPLGPFQVRYAQYTREFGDLRAGSEAIHRWAQFGGQTIATVQGKTIWVAVSEMESGFCQVSAAETSDWMAKGWTRLDQHCGQGRVVAAEAADLDGDGDDEVVVATLSGAAIDASVVQISYAGSPGSPSLSLSPEPVKTKRNLGGYPLQVDVAIGDLDGKGRENEDLDEKGRKNEVVIAYNTTLEVTSPGTVGMYVYRYEEGGLQPQGPAQRFTPWTDGDPDGDQPPASVWDFEIDIGKVRASDDDHEQVVLAVETAVFKKLSFWRKRFDLSWSAYIYEWPDDGRGDRSIVEIEQKYVVGPQEFAAEISELLGPFSIALSTGDIDGNGLEEIVLAQPLQLYTSSAEGCHDCLPGATDFGSTGGGVRALTMGDVDGDSRAEIIRFTDFSAGALDVIDWADVTHEVPDWVVVEAYTDTHLFVTGQLQGIGGRPLLADLDGTSLQAELKGCDDYNDVRVTAVVNGVPRYYEGDEPVQPNGGGYATGNSHTTGQEKGVTGFYGGSVAVGRSVGNELLKATFKAEEEYLRRIGTSTKTEESTATEKGETLYDSEERGLVVYTSSAYRCCHFDSYYPSAPEDKSEMVTCTPAEAQPQTSALLTDWNSELFKTEVGPSWVDVGRASAPEVNRDTNSVFTYPDNLPVDPYLALWHDTSNNGPRTLVKWSSDPGANPHSWGLEQSKGGEKVHKGSKEFKTTLSAALEAGHFEFEVAAIGGFETEHSDSVGWEESLSFEGEAFDYPVSCPEEVCQGSYTIQPFLWEATATTKAGVTYPYLELDYYVPSPPGTLAEGEGGIGTLATVGIVPEQPVITSPTHPDPGTWYDSRDVTFDWEQPSGDPATVTGYRWNLNDQADFEPTALHRVMSDTITIEGVADGLHYLHLQARGDGGDDSPVAHRALRVDADPPLVEIQLDPLAPDGLNGWHVSPVQASVSVTDGLGSGVSTVEFSTDGTVWQPYTAPIDYVLPTAGTTLWARATDGAGHTSEPVTTTLKIDQAAPSSMDGDGVGLSYHNVSTDLAGNAQLVLGGASNDTLAGRSMVEVRAADTGAWRRVHKVGEFPMPPDNDLASTMLTVNWVYSPTRQIRGIYPLWGRSIDAAGVQEADWVFGTLWWEPEGEPELSQSRVSVAPRHAFPGDTVRFTLGLRNTGVQEAQVAVTDDLPPGLTPVLDSISDGGQYDDGAGTIDWILHGLWPGETRFLTFDAQVDPGLAPTEPLVLENHVDLLGYWPWQPAGPPEPPSHPFSTSTTVTVLPAAMAGEAVAQAATHPPAIYTAKVLEGDIVQNPQTTLYLHTSSDAEFLFVKEWVWDREQSNWALAKGSGWLPFTEGDGLAVNEDGAGKHGLLTWQLSPGDGVKYLGVWAANGDKHTTNLNEGLLLFTNYVSPSGQQLAAGERVQYRLPLTRGQLGLLALATQSGDADLYAWKPLSGFRPHYFSNEAGEPLLVEGLGISAEETGVYLVEVEAAGQDSFYRLLVGGDIAGGVSESEVRTALGLPVEGATGQAIPQGVHLTLDEKERPEHPLTLGTPFALPDAEDLDEVPPFERNYQNYLPLIFKEG